MRLGTPFDTLHDALAAAAYHDMPEMTYEDRDWDAWRALSKEDQGNAMKNNAIPTVTKTRRLMTDELEVVMFPQTWGSTATGYGGLGGSAMTSVYTVIVSYNHYYYCVYFGCGRLAYKLDRSKMSDEGYMKFRKDIADHSVSDVIGSGKYL